MSTLKVNAIQNTSGVEQYLCKAWVNFNGTGTVAIRASGNVSSITDNGVGDYTVNFTNAMVDANYSAVIYPATAGSVAIWIAQEQAVPTVSSLRFGTRSSAAVLNDLDRIQVAIFR